MRAVCLILLLICTVSSALAADRYTVRFDAGLKSVDVRACFDGAAPGRLFRHDEARLHSKGPRFGGKPLKTRDHGSSLALSGLPDDACIDWSVDLISATSGPDHRTAFRLEGDVVTSTDLWFWKGDWQRDIEVSVEVPREFHFSAPWRNTGTPGEQVYRPHKTPASWSSRTAVGRTPPRLFPALSTGIHLAMIGDLSTEDADKLAAWIRRSLESVTGVYGQFPQDSLQVLVIGIGRRGDPVPWAHVIRGGGPAVELFVDHTRPLSSLDEDWTATHEFSHLLLPYVSSRDRWLSEGLASYYQNVLRARDGRLTDQQAWQKLYNGFRRGERGTANGTLAEATRAGWDQTMRVYWSGAAMLLTADARLRAQSGGAQSLDSVLKSFNTCCQAAGKAWRAWEVLMELDRISGTAIFTTVYREHVYSEEFPDWSEIYRDLGLRTRFGRIGMVDNAPLEEIRGQIMGPAPG